MTVVRFSAKDAKTLMVRTGMRTTEDHKCIVCGTVLPEGRSKYCSTACSRVNKDKGKPKGKPRKQAGYKVSKCRYCGLRADSSDIKRTYTDAAQVKWFKCPCSPTESQLVNKAVMEP